ncbi:hypothetical protein CEW89_13950 [Celeribacter ethanolicus]|uniref:DUF4123 domain-containing protein n=1 Tax=Celeribacter ethanolicus TaxID=1758178 RepID=A0A291GDF3_9RHOB|nr:DUF4123 domain-containing protein [Celeribacter ethanolicus]ATG48563.1 hypothetical protein CEW89_13950 [Celeribacter ethanolicus]
MTKFEAWIGECHFTTSGGEEAHCHCAVWADGYATFRAGVEASVLYQNLSLIRLQNVQPVVTLSDVPAHIMELAQAVHSGHPAEMGAMSVIAKHANGHTAESYLTITEHEIAPLSDQTDIPFWDRAWIAPELKELLFCQPQDGPKMRTYLIVDATLRKNVIGAFDLDNVDVPVQCLFKGSAAEELKESAPYLIDMTLPDGAWDDGGLVPAFHKSFFAKHWDKGTGVFIQSTYSQDAVKRHFRRMTKYIGINGTSYFFRFWESNCIFDYFSGIMWNLEKCKRIYFSHHARVESIICYGRLTHRIHSIVPKSDLLSCDHPSTSAFRIDAQDEQSLMKSILRPLSISVANAWASEYGYQSQLNSRDIEEAALACIERMHGYGIRNSGYLRNIAIQEIFLGCHLENDTTSLKLKRFLQSGNDEKMKYQAIREYLMEAHKHD